MKNLLTALVLAVPLYSLFAQQVKEQSKVPEEMRSLALKKIPASYHHHPEFGKYSLDINTPNIELLHLRTAQAKTFLDNKGRYYTQQTAGVSNFKDASGWISMQEKVSVQDSRAGIFRTDLPLYVDLQNGKTVMSLDRSGLAMEYGQSTLNVLDKDMGRISEISSQYAGNYRSVGNELVLENYYANIDRIQNLTYWSLQTDFLIRSRMDFGDQAAFVEFQDRVRLPEGWTLSYAEGEMASPGFQGTLQVLNERGGIVSEISRPVLYDDFHPGKKEDLHGHSILGYYSITTDGSGAYLLGLRVPVSWLNSGNLVYPVRIDPTVNNTYAAGQGLQDKNTTFSSGCQAAMSVSIPIGYYQVTGTNISYTIQAKGYIAGSGGTTYYGDREEQRSRIASGANWTATQSGSGADHSGGPNNQAYSLTNQTIANGCYNGVSSISYIWQGYQTFFPTGSPSSTNVTGCVTNYQELLANTWVVTVTYQAVTLALSTSNVSTCVTKPVTLTPTITGATAISWSPATNLSSALVASPVANPPATTVYTVTATDGFCSQSGTVTVTVNEPASTGLSSGDWVFTGSVSSEYENPANWLKWTGAGYTAILTYAGQTGVRPPQVTDNVRIKAGGACVLNQPVVMNAADGGFTAPNSVSANCKNIVIEPGATLGFSSNASHFHIAETWNNTGTLTPSNGRIKFIGSGAQSVNGSGAQTFYEMNVGANSITTLNVGVTVTAALRLNGIVVTGSNLFHLTNTAADATSLPISTGHIFGTFRRSIAANTNIYGFPVGVGTTLNTHRRMLEFINNNVSGVSYLDCSVSNSFKGLASNIDALLDPLKAKHNLLLFTNVSGEAEWRLTPNTNPSGGSYGVRLYLQNFSALIDNNFSVLKRPDNSNTFFDFSAFYTSTSIPAASSAGRIYSGGAGYAQKTGFTTFSKFVVASTPTPLPVELTDFGAACHDAGTEILWTTASEHNSMKFVVERSRDLNAWEYVDQRTAAGNSGYTIHYAAADEHPLNGISYYRLVQIDNDGQTNIYGPVSVSCQAGEGGISVFPNPSQGSFTVEISSGDMLDTEVQLIDIAGKIVEKRRVKVSGVSQVLFNDPDIQAGTYIIRLSGNEYQPVRIVIR